MAVFGKTRLTFWPETHEKKKEKKIYRADNASVAALQTRCQIFRFQLVKLAGAAENYHLQYTGFALLRRFKAKQCRAGGLYCAQWKPSRSLMLELLTLICAVAREGQG